MHKSHRSHDLRAFLEAQVTDLLRLVQKLRRLWSAEQVHNVRVATRRVEVALAVLPSGVPRKKRKQFGKALRRLRQALGPLRNIDVMLLHLAAYQDSAQHKPVVRCFKRLLQQRRQVVVRKLQHKLYPARLGHAWTRLKRDLSALGMKCTPDLRRYLTGHLESLLTGAQQLEHGRQARIAIDRRDVHAVRIEAKIVRYTLDLEIAAGIDVPPAVVRCLKQLQAALGLWHDYLLLSEYCVRITSEEDCDRSGTPSFGQVLAFSQQCWRDSERRLDRFGRIWSGNRTAATKITRSR